MNKRISYFDNFKFILIFFVVLGHFLAPLRDTISGVKFIYMFIYIFHMPLFIFILGYFSKTLLQDGKLKNNKIFNYLLLYVIMQMILYLIKNTSFTILFPQHGMWYLQCVIIWSILLPTLSKIKAKVLLPLTFALGIVVSCDSKSTDVLSLNRAIIFLPYFLCGYYINKEKIINFISRIDIRHKVVALLFIITTAIILYLLPLNYHKIVQLMYGNSISNLSFKQAICYRSMAYMLSLFVGGCIMLLIPNKKHFFTSFGNNTLQVYCIHIILFQLYDKLKLYHLINNHFQLGIFIILLVILTSFLSLKIFSIPFNKIMNLKFERFLKE